MECSAPARIGRATKHFCFVHGLRGKALIANSVCSITQPSFSNAALIGNTAASDYNALQIQFQRRLSRGLQVLGSYTLSHSIDDGSLATYGTGSNTFVPGLSPNSNRGSSDFDIRNLFSTALTYDIPAPKTMRSRTKSLRGWSLENVIQAWSAPPVNIFDWSFPDNSSGRTQIRPDVVPGVPMYLYGRQYPGGKAINSTPNQGGPDCPGAFSHHQRMRAEIPSPRKPREKCVKRVRRNSMGFCRPS